MLSRLAIKYVDTTVEKVVGIDIDPLMLKIAHSCYSLYSSRRDAIVDLIQGSALSLPFPNGFFDLIVCQHGLQFFSNKLKTLREINIVLVGDGRVT